MVRAPMGSSCRARPNVLRLLFRHCHRAPAAPPPPCAASAAIAAPGASRCGASEEAQRRRASKASSEKGKGQTSQQPPLAPAAACCRSQGRGAAPGVVRSTAIATRGRKAAQATRRGAEALLLALLCLDVICGARAPAPPPRGAAARARAAAVASRESAEAAERRIAARRGALVCARACRVVISPLLGVCAAFAPAAHFHGGPRAPLAAARGAARARAAFGDRGSMWAPPAPRLALHRRGGGGLGWGGCRDRCAGACCPTCLTRPRAGRNCCVIVCCTRGVSDASGRAACRAARAHRRALSAAVTTQRRVWSLPSRSAACRLLLRAERVGGQATGCSWRPRAHLPPGTAQCRWVRQENAGACVC